MKQKMNSLRINKDPKDTRVVVAMSGGVDSSVTAALLHEAGYDVIGITLQLFDYGNAVARPGTCCAGQDIYDAKRVADLGLSYRASPGETQGARATPAARPDPGDGEGEDTGDGSASTDPATEQE